AGDDAADADQNKRCRRSENCESMQPGILRATLHLLPKSMVVKTKLPRRATAPQQPFPKLREITSLPIRNSGPSCLCLLAVPESRRQLLNGTLRSCTCRAADWES